MKETVSEAVLGRPASGLRPWVDGYVGYRQLGFEPGMHSGLPSPHMTFVISLSDPVEIAAMPGNRQSPCTLQAFVAGLHTGAARIAHDGNQYGISVDLTPLGTRALLGVPAGELAWYTVTLDELLGSEYGSLPDRLASCATWPGRFAILDDALVRALAARRATAPPPEVTEAFRQLVASNGSLPVGTVAEHVGWSRRHLGERFREEIGLSPKAVARVARFDRARHLLASGRFGLAEIAAIGGYADQPHFNREFRELAGRTPTEWLAEELPSVQDPDVVEAAG